LAICGADAVDPPPRNAAKSSLATAAAWEEVREAWEEWEEVPVCVWELEACGTKAAGAERERSSSRAEPPPSFIKSTLEPKRSAVEPKGSGLDVDAWLETCRKQVRGYICM